MNLSAFAARRPGSSRATSRDGSELTHLSQPANSICVFGDHHEKNITSGMFLQLEALQ